jgi:hypothetical protein
MSVPFNNQTSMVKLHLARNEEATAYKQIKSKMNKQREKIEKKELKLRQN